MSKQEAVKVCKVVNTVTGSTVQQFIFKVLSDSILFSLPDVLLSNRDKVKIGNVSSEILIDSGDHFEFFASPLDLSELSLSGCSFKIEHFIQESGRIVSRDGKETYLVSESESIAA